MKDIPDAKAGRFLGDVSTLVSGTTVAQGLTILVAPILARLYSPASFGTFAIFSSIVGILTTISCLRYEHSIVLPESDSEAANLFASSIILVSLVSLLTLVAVCLVGRDLVLALNAPGLETHLWLFPPVVFASGQFLAFSYWNTRTRHFGRLSIATVIGSASRNGTQLGVGYMGHVTEGGLIAAFLVGHLASAIALAGQIWRDDGRLIRGSVNIKDMLSGLHRYRKFPLFDLGSVVLNALSLQAPVFMLSIFFSSDVTGYYDMGYRMLKLPTILVGQAIAQVFFQRTAQAIIAGELTQLVLEVFKQLVTLGLFPFLLFTVIGREIFLIAFGEGWAEAGTYVQILSLWVFFVFISYPIGTLSRSLEKQEATLIFNVILLVSRVFSIAVGGLFSNARLALSLFGLTGVLAFVGYCFWLMSVAEVPLSRTLAILSKGLLFCSPFLGVVLLAKLRLAPTPWALAMLGFGMACLYYIAAFRRDGTLVSIANSLRLNPKFLNRG